MPKSKVSPLRPPAMRPADYRRLFLEIRNRVQAARSRAVLAVNREMLGLYWEVGNLILCRQQNEGWGSKVIDRLSRDLQKAFPGQQGYSLRNLKYMRAFAAAWPQRAIVQRPVAQIGVEEKSRFPIVQQPAAQISSVRGPGRTGRVIRRDQLPEAAGAIVHQAGAQLPWRHHTILLDKLSSQTDRLWYAAKTVEHGWSRNVLALQIEAGLHRRQGQAVTNFKQTLPPAMSDVAQELTKDPYVFDFLVMQKNADEKQVETGLLAQVEELLLELGAGFALVGRQVRLEVGGQEYFLDLLFYHLKLRSFVVIDLKMREFTPEAAGKMNFYLSAVDDRFRQPGDQPSWGLILCRQKNRVVAEYALRDLRKPIGVSGFVTRLVDSLPKRLKGAMPAANVLTRGLKRLGR